MNNRAPQNRRDLPSVLNLFEGVAWAVKAKVVALELVWSTIGDSLMYYWLAFDQQITQERADDLTVWALTAWLVDELRNFSRKRGLKDPDAYNRKNLAAVMKHEAELDD